MLVMLGIATAIKHLSSEIREVLQLLVREDGHDLLALVIVRGLINAQRSTNQTRRARRKTFRHFLPRFPRTPQPFSLAYDEHESPRHTSYGSPRRHPR